MPHLQINVVMFLSVLFCAQPALAALPPSLELFDEELNQIQLEQAQQQADQANVISDELFPERKDDSDVDQMKPSAESVATHVTVNVRGTSVMLEDVSVDAWFAQYVEDMAASGIISGYQDEEGNPLGQYGPADNVTIEQLAKIAAQAAGVDLQACVDPLVNEQAQGRWSESYIRCAEYRNWAIYSDGTVDVARAATRTEVVTTILQAFGAAFESLDGTVFQDVNATTEFAVAIETAAAHGIVSGYTDEEGNLTGYFGPSDPVNRAEIAKIVSLALQIY